MLRFGLSVSHPAAGASFFRSGAFSFALTLVFTQIAGVGTRVFGVVFVRICCSEKKFKKKGHENCPSLIY